VSFLSSLKVGIASAPANSVCGAADSWTGRWALWRCGELDEKRFFWYHPEY